MADSGSRPSDPFRAKHCQIHRPLSSRPPLIYNKSCAACPLLAAKAANPNRHLDNLDARFGRHETTLMPGMVYNNYDSFLHMIGNNRLT